MLQRVTILALASAVLLLPSCESLQSPKSKQSVAWAGQHAAFRTSDGWKKTSFVNEEVVGKLNTGNTSLQIVLSEQRGLLLHENRDVAIDFPISSGRKRFPTKPGSYTVIDKKRNHSSNLYGKYVDTATGDVINSDVDTSVDPMPEGANYVGAPMPYFLRLTNAGLGLHVGIVPGYPASHGCVRVPKKIMPQIYGLVPRGASVEIVKESAPSAAVSKS